MSLASYLTVDRISVQAEPSDKPAALREVAALLSEGLDFSAADVLAVLEERERLATTGVGTGVAIPHGRMDVEATRAALLISRPGVPFESIDGGDVHLILGVLAPASQPTKLLRMLAEASRVLRHEATRDALVACESADAVLAVLEELA